MIQQLILAQSFRIKKHACMFFLNGVLEKGAPPHKPTAAGSTIKPDRAILRMIGAGELFFTKLSESECF